MSVTILSCGPVRRETSCARATEKRVGLAGAALGFAVALMMASCGFNPACAQQTPPPPSAAAPIGTPAETQQAHGVAPSDAAPKAASGKTARASTPVYHLLGFSLGGTDRLDTDALIATLPQHKGDVITRAEIDNDTIRIKAALNAAHVHGDMTTAMLEREGKGHYLMVVWEVHLVDALSYAHPDRERRFGDQTFSGNVKLSADELTAATKLKPGQAMPDGSVGDARTGIEQAYDKALPGKPVEVSGKVVLKKDHTVSINWHINEPG